MRTLGLLPSILIKSIEKHHLTGRWSLVLSFLQYKFPYIYRSLSDSDSKLDLPKTQAIKPLPWVVTLRRWSHYLTASSSCHEATPTAGYQPPSWIPAFRLEIEPCGALCQSITFVFVRVSYAVYLNRSMDSTMRGRLSRPSICTNLEWL